MENGVIEFDIGLGGGDDAIDIEPPNDDGEMPDGSPNDANSLGSGSGDTAFAQSYVPDGDLDLEPYEGMEFESEEAAKAFYNSYARRVGFSTRVSSSRRSRKDGAIIQRSFVCAKEGFRNLNEKRTKDREIKRPRTVTRWGVRPRCPSRYRILENGLSRVSLRSIITSWFPLTRCIASDHIAKSLGLQRP
ncbi:UNVERIFIED_CONTAM: protein FAR1-RELATED SEQUENCE 5 [Sesamum latifolium]|uniref:Protein FAR1-RELATED SEQUENCE 5 n=1 Tax=Sesamum latifolium TaxID=2727402 RepID=A0AAW2Y2Z8_9LAMI